MNRITKEIMTHLLQNDAYWHKETRELLYDRILHAYTGVRESRFLDEVYFPRMFRAMSLLRTNTGKTELFEEVTMEGITGWWLENDTDACWEMQERFGSEHYFRETYFQRIWNSPDWAYERPTEEEILSLGIRPTLVPLAVRKDGSIQLSF